MSDKHAQETQIRFQLIIYETPLKRIIHAILQQRAQIKKRADQKHEA